MPITPKPRTAFALLVVVAWAVTPGAAQDPAERRPGPVIEDFGAVYDVPDPDMDTPVDHVYRVVFDVGRSSEVPGSLNPWLDTVARFLNMHARAGVPPGNMELAVVLHGEAARDALLEGPFLERFGATNRNTELLRRLADAGVELYMCGQSAASRGLPADQLLEPVQTALSAMTARVVLESRGYRPVN